MPSLQSTVILATALLGSLFQHAAAAAASPPSSPAGGVKRAGAEFPACIATCMRDSGCFDAKCVCRKAGDGILSDIVICMNQWCPADVTADDLIGPLEGQCDLPRAAVQDAEKKGGVADDEPTSTGKGGDDDAVTMTFDLGKPVTNPAGPATTVTPAASGTLTVTNAAAAAATTGLLTDEGASASSGGSLGAATSLPASPSSTAAAGDSSDDKDNAAGLAGRASIFGIVAAMGFALALGL